VTLRRSLLVALLVGAGAAAPATAARIDDRTQRVSAASVAPNGASSSPSISPGGTIVAFQSSASNLAADPNGAVQDIFVRDTLSDRVSLISLATDGGGANGPSRAPVLAGLAASVAFVSDASNLVDGDTNASSDVFVRRVDGTTVRVSVGTFGGEGNGASYEPDISRDGRFVVFTSKADNLVPDDDNGVEDVFLRDLQEGITQRVSEASGFSVDGRSRAPSISTDGSYISFESTASELVEGDTNGVPDVFLARRSSGDIRRVSVSSKETQQNKAVVPPFVMVSDVSDGGRYVAFDSDATNLVPNDRNQDTDVFIRDVRAGKTDIASLGATGRQGDNDSYFPSLSRDGRYVAYTSFARNLWPRDPAGEDLYLYDRELRRTTLLTVTGTGKTRKAETSPQLLRRAAVADGAGVVAFSSTAPLATGDADSLEDVVVRDTEPPQGRILSGPHGVMTRSRPRLHLAADDPNANVFSCKIDGRTFICPLDGRLPLLKPGRHVLSVRAGGPGMLFDPTPVVRTFRVR
jgi:Tol biopolymer transport system component